MDALKRYKEHPEQPEAQEELYTACRGFLYRLALHYVDNDNAVAIEDLLQIGFFAVLKAADTYKEIGEKTFFGWLRWYVVRAYRRAVGWLRFVDENGEPYVHYKHKTASLDAPLQTDEELTIADTIEDETAINPEESAVYNSIREVLEACINKLEPKKAELIRLHYWHELTLKETAERMGLEYSRACVLKVEALKALRKMKDIRALQESDIDYCRGCSVASFIRTKYSTTEIIAFRRMGRSVEDA